MAIKPDKKYDFIGLLEPTSPFVQSTDLDKAIELLEKNDNASAIVATRESNPNRLFIQKEEEYLNGKT